MIEHISEKVKAIQAAESCINTLLILKPDAVDPMILALLSELKVDLFDAMFEQENSELFEIN